MPNFPASADTDTTLFLAKNLKTTTLSGSHTNSVTTLTVVSTTGFPTAGWLRIEEPTSGTVELVSYTNISGATFTGCTRGADADFPAQAHNNGATVTLAVVSAHHNALKDTILAMQAWNGVLGTMMHASVTGASYTATTADGVIPVNAASNNVTINLFTAVGNAGRILYITRTDNAPQFTVTVDANGSQTIDGSLTLLIRALCSVALVSDGSNWQILSTDKALGMFEMADSGTAATGMWMVDGSLLFDASAVLNGTAYEVGTTSTAAFAQGTFVTTASGSLPATALPNGTIIEYVAMVSTNKLPTANTAESGVCLTSVAPAAATFSTTTATQHCVVVGFDSDAVWKILTSNGAAKTVTTTGITAAINTRYKIKIIWTVGTNVVVQIDSNAPVTVTATLPTIMVWHGASKAATNAAGDKLTHFGGAWRVTQ